MCIPLSHHLFFAYYLFRMLLNFIWLHDFESVSEMHLARPTQLPYLIVETILTLRLAMHLCFKVIVRLQATASPLNFIWNYIKFYIVQSHMLHTASSLHSFPLLYKMFHFFPPKAVLGGATQCDCTERSRTTGDLHCEWRERGSICVQSDSRQHRAPSSFRVRRPTPRGTAATTLQLNIYLWFIVSFCL